jgi:hypothetical protein
MNSEAAAVFDANVSQRMIPHLAFALRGPRAIQS